MDSERQRVIELIGAEFGPAMQRDVIAHIWKPYEEAARLSRDFDPAQRRKVYGHHRLALTEQSLKVFCRKHPTLTATDYRQEGRSYDYFTMTSSSLALTVKAVSAPDQLPPKSLFRDTMASGSNFSLFDDVEPVAGRKYFHVLLLHNCERRVEYDEETGEYRKIRVLSRPGFVTLAVPEPDGKECIIRRSLFADHPNTVAQLRGVAVEDVPESEKNKPRARPKTNEERDTGSD